MKNEDKEFKLIEIFCQIDDFCQNVANWAKENEVHCVSFHGQMQVSELLTILVFYHHSGYKNFQYYYQSFVLGDGASCFPRAVSYKRFLTLIPRCFNHLLVLAHVQCIIKSQKTGVYFADSKKLPVCDNRRIHSNRVFKGIANRGKSSTGWFYGLKLHLVINNLGQVINFLVTPANVSDNKVLEKLFENIKGECYADKGYLTKLFQKFFNKGLHIVSKIRNNMKNQLMPLQQKWWLMKRGVIESVNDLLMTVFDIDHTRHRSPINAITHAIAGLIAYSFYDVKPSVILPNSH